MKIIYADDSGGIKTISHILHKSFLNNSIENEVFNMNDYGNNLFKKLFNSLKKIRKLNKREIFILQHYDPIFLGLFMRMFGYENLINVVHTDLVAYYKSVNFYKKAVIRLIFFLIKKKTIIFVSKEAELKANFFFKLTSTITIYNIHNFDITANNRIKDANIITLGSISRLHALKNIDLTIRLVKVLNKKQININLIIYGDGEQKKLLSKYIKKQGCETYIKLMGPSNNKKEMYGSIDALVSFSSIEGFSMTALESISFNKPVLYTDCSSGPRELMAPGSNPLNKTNSFEKTSIGYLVKPVLDVATYSDNLTDYEKEYVSILNNFINDVKYEKFSMEFDASPFTEKFLIKKWLEVLNSYKLC